MFFRKKKVGFHPKQPDFKINNTLWHVLTQVFRRNKGKNKFEVPKNNRVCSECLFWGTVFRYHPKTRTKKHDGLLHMFSCDVK